MTKRLHFIVRGAIFLMAAAAWAAAPTPPDWIRWFIDDFEDGTARRWRIDDALIPQAIWKIEKDGANTVFAGHGHIFTRVKTGRGSDYRFKARVKILRGGVHFNVRDECTRYFIGLSHNRLYLNRTRPCAQHQELRSLAEPIELNKWYTLEIVALGDEIKVYLDDVLKINYTDQNPVLIGGLTIESLQDDGYVLVDDVEVTGPPAAASALRVLDVWLPDVIIGVPFSYQLSAEGGTPPYKWSAVAGNRLPAGVRLSEDGKVSGTPSARGDGDVTVMVTDSEGRRAFEMLDVNVDEAGVSSSRRLPPGEVGKPYTTKLEAAGIRGEFQWVGMMLPPGLALNAATGELSGVPTMGGVFQSVVACLSSRGIEAYGLPGFYATEPDPSPLAFVAGTDELFALGAPGKSTGTAIQVTGGTPPYALQVTAGELPPGMRLLAGDAVPGEGNPDTTVIAGWPTSIGKYRFTIQATDSAGAKASQEFELPITWMSTDAPDDLQTLGVPFSADMRTEGGIPPIQWAGDVIPAGFELSADGKLTGAPAECGFLWMAGRATDSDNPPVTQRFSTGFVTLCTANLFSQVDIQLPFFTPKLKRGEPQEFRIGLANGSGRGYQLSISSGGLPPGMNLAEGGLPGLFFVSGTPTEAGTFECFLRATDDGGAFGIRRLKIVVE